MIIYLITSLLIGVLPEVIYFTLFIILAKDIKERKKRLFLGIFLIYIIFAIIFKYKLLAFWGMIIAMYLYMKILYKNTNLIDMVTIYFASSYLTLISYIGFINFDKDLSNYYVLLAINRLIIFLPFLGRKKFHSIYLKVKSMWNRNDTIKKPLKSITLRNIIFIFINILIFFMNYYLIQMMQFRK